MYIQGYEQATVELMRNSRVTGCSFLTAHDRERERNEMRNKNCLSLIVCPASWFHCHHDFSHSISALLYLVRFLRRLFSLSFFFVSLSVTCSMPRASPSKCRMQLDNNPSSHCPLEIVPTCCQTIPMETELWIYTLGFRRINNQHVALLSAHFSLAL